MFGTNWPMLAPQKCLEGLSDLDLSSDQSSAFLHGNGQSRIRAVDQKELILPRCRDTHARLLGLKRLMNVKRRISVTASCTRRPSLECALFSIRPSETSLLTSLVMKAPLETSRQNPPAPAPIAASSCGVTGHGNRFEG